MTGVDGLPAWAILLVAALLVLGSSLTLLGTVGLLRLKSFYDRIHAPTLGTSWGTAAILLASLLSWFWGPDRIVVHELVIGICVMVTTPVTLMLLVRAALHRDRVEGRPGPTFAADLAGSGQGRSSEAEHASAAPAAGDATPPAAGER